MILTPRDWQNIATVEAARLDGAPEAHAKLIEANRYGALADEIGRLKSALNWIATVNATENEYQNHARAALASPQPKEKPMTQIKLCKDCVWCKPSNNGYPENRCHEPKVAAQSSDHLSNKKPNGVSCNYELAMIWPRGLCGRRGAKFDNQARP
jgi:hypothetical protein